ncbi:MAG: hypothetical protein U9O20_03105 [Patescibacteria group bacterium]|nr:hypothetical protein [Patescibacteria group bacterium]
MKKINLKSSELTVKREKKRSSNTSLSVGIILLLVAVGSYGVLMLMNQKTVDEIATVNSEIEKIKKELDGDEFHELYDFQSRLYEIEDLIKGKRSQSMNLEKIAAFTLSGTSFVKLEQAVEGQQSEIVATISVVDHYALSQQLEAYSLMDGAKEVSLVKSEQADEGIQADLKFLINKS